MSSVDNRVVNMMFNGAQFLNGVSNAINALSNLQNSLKMTEATKGMENLSASMNKLDVSGIQGSVDGIAGRFSTLGVIGMGVLSRIGASAADAGMQLVKSLTVAPVMQGFNEMELKMKSIQTILSNTQSRYGTNINDVTTALDELNTYADKTIYNFAEMTQNIGRFTTAGLDLDTSVSGIKGLANLGAFFNASSTDVSRAMYQMSQAMASGTVKLMDWNSLVNANMGGTEFTDDLMRVARKHGIAIDQMIADEGSFRETLQKGWLTNDIFLESLSHFATDVDAIGEDTYRAQLAAEGWSEAEIDKIVYLGRTATEAATKVRSWTQLWDTLAEEAGSGWAQTWELIFGNFEESTELFNGAYKMLNPLISGMGQVRNDLLQGWKDLGGRDSLINTVTTLGSDAIGILTMLGEAAGDAFNITPQGLYDFTKGLEDFVSSLQLSEDAINDAKNTFEGFFSIFSIAGKVIGFGAGVVGELVQAFFPLTEGILDVTGAFGEGISGFNRWLDESQVFQNALEGLHTFLTPVRDLMSDVSTGIGEFVEFVIEEIQKLSPVFDEVFGGIKTTLEGAKDWFSGLMDGWSGGLDQAGEFIKGGIPGFKEGVDGMIDNLLNFIHPSAETVAEADKDKTMLDRFGDTIGGFLTNFVSGVENFLTGTSTLSSYNLSEKGGEALGNVVSMFTAIPWGDVLAVVGVFGTAKAFGNMAKTFTAARKAFTGVFSILDDFKGLIGAFTNIGNSTALYIKLQGFAALVESFAPVIAALAALSFVEGMNPGATGRTIGAISAILWQFAGLMALVGIISAKSKTRGIATFASEMMIFAGALTMMAAAVSLLGGMDEASLANGVVAVSALTAMLGAIAALFSTKIGFTKGGFSAAFGAGGRMKGLISELLAIVASVALLAKVVQSLGGMDPDAVTQGLGAVGQIMLSLVGVITAMSLLSGSSISAGGFSFKSKGLPIRTILGLVAMVASVKVLASAVSDLGSLSSDVVSQGLTIMSSILVALSATMAGFALISKIGAVKVRNIAGLVAAVASIKVLADAVSQLGGMYSGNLDKGMSALWSLTAVLGTLMGVFTILSRFNGGIFKSLGTVAILTGAVNSLKGLIEAVRSITDIGIENVGLGAAGIFGLLASLAAGFALLNAAAKNARGASLLVFAVFLSTLASTMQKFSGLGIEQTVQAVVAMASALTVIGVAAALLGPSAASIAALGAALLVFNTAALVGAAAIFVLVEAFQVLGNIAGPALQNIITALPKLAVGIVDALVDAISALASRAGEVATAFGQIVLAGIQGIAGISGELITTLLDILIDVFNGIGEYAPQLVDAIVNMLVKVFDAVARNIEPIIHSVKELVVAIATAMGNEFGNIKFDQANMDGIVKSMYEIFGLVALMKFSGIGIKDAAKTMGELMLVFGPMVGLFALISLCADSDAVAALNSINNSVGLIAAVCGAFSFIPVEGAVNAIVGLDLFIANLAVVLAALGALKQIPGVEWLISEGGDFLGTLGEAIGQFIGGIGGGIASQFSNSFGPIGENLAEFAAKASPFFDLVQGMDDSITGKMESFKTLIQTVVGLGGSANYGAGKLKGLSEFMPELSTVITTFNSNIKDINPENLNSVSALLESLKGITESLPTINPGTGQSNMMSLTDFANDLASFASVIKTTIDQIGPGDSFDTSGMLSVIDVAKQLNDLQLSLPDINNGSSAWFSGSTQTLNSFAKGIVEMSDSIKQLQTDFPSAEGFDISGIQQVIEIVKQLAQVQVDLASGTTFNTTWISWDKFVTLGEMGNQLAILADNLRGKDFSFAEFGRDNGFDAGRMRNMISMLKGLAEIQVELAQIKTSDTWVSSESYQMLGGLAQNIASHIEDFKMIAGLQIDTTSAANLTNFINVIKGFADIFSVNMADYNPDNIERFVSSLKSLSTIFSGTLGEVGGGSFLNNVDFAQVAANIQAVAGAIPSLIGAFNSLSTVSGEGGESVGGNIQGFLDSLDRLFSYDFGAVLTNLQTSAEGIRSSIGETLTGLTEDFSAKVEEFRTIGTNMGNALVEGMNSVGTDTSSLQGLAQSALDALGSKSDDFRTKGEESGQKYVDGVSSKQGPAEDAARSMASSAASAAEGGYDAFYSAGANAAQGYVDGINAKLADARTAAAALASVAAGATNKAQQSRSPSRVFRKIGINAALGYILGIQSEEGAVKDEAMTMVSNALATAYEMSQSKMEFNPVIAPVYDGTELDAGLASSDMLLRGLQSRALATAVGLSSGISTRMNPDENETEAQETPGTTIVQNFTQNNTSPKALSRLDIYKDTKTLFALAKEAAVK